MSILIKDCRNMICPRDQHALQESRSEGYTLHFCPDCHGVFVQLNQKTSPGLSNSIIQPDQRPRVPVTKDELCLSPITGRPMLVFKHRGTIIDYCTDSNSVWLDSGELEKISIELGAYPHRKKRSASKRKWTRSHGASMDSDDVAGIVIEFALEALTAIF